MNSPLYRGGANWQSEVTKLRKMGHALPNSAPAARAEAANIATAVNNRTLTATMNRQRLASYRQGSNMQMAIPKMREPLGSLRDKGIPFNVDNYEELCDIRRWCRLFYTTHDLVPLLIDIYARFPCVGLEFESKDPMIKKFYENMFLGDDLNYLEFLPNSLGREYWICGEVTSLGHFSESLGVWSSEEILNPDHIRVSRSLFVQRERVQLMVKDMVESLRQGPMSQTDMLSTTEETRSERLQRTEEYQQLARDYPEIIEAAMQDDGLDISEALISRLVNRSNPRANYGTPHLLRSFRTLMMEESLNAAQDAVSDRLYSPLILATLGVPDLGDGEPWIPDQSELDDTRDDMQTALSADFRLLVHNFGLKIESVFGRESVPNLDNDYQRIDEKLLQAWGIGEALISGGTGGPYASSALNREVVTQLMLGFQNALRRHIVKRAEVVAEAQGHFDYDLKGGIHVPIMRKIVVDEGTEDEHTIKVPKLLTPDVKFASLNLRDEAQERAFIAQLKAMGVPVSDKMLAVNIDMEFDNEVERQADETVKKLVATAQAMRKAQILCDKQNLPYPAELSQHLMSTLQLRQGKDQTEQLDAQTPVVQEQSALQLEQLEMQKAQMDQMMMGGGMPMQMLPPGAPMDPGMGGGAPPPGQGGVAPAGADPSANGGVQTAGPGAPGPAAPGPGAAPAGFYAANTFHGPRSEGPAGFFVAAERRRGVNVTGPLASPSAAAPPSAGMGPELPPGIPEPTEVAQNRSTGTGISARPEISDEQRKSMPKTSGRRKRIRRGEDIELTVVSPEVPSPRRLSRFERGPSSYGSSKRLSGEEVLAHVQRREAVQRHMPARHPQVADLVKDPNFFRATNSQAYQGQIQADWPEMLAGGAQDSRKLLDACLEQYFEIYGVEPSW